MSLAVDKAVATLAKKARKGEAESPNEEAQRLLDAAGLGDPATRGGTLDTLTTLSTRGSGAGGKDMPRRLTVLAALTTLMATEQDAKTFRQIGVLALAIITEAEDVMAAFGAAAGGGRCAAVMGATKNAAARALRTNPKELTTDHALTYAAARGYHHNGVFLPDCDKAFGAAGLSLPDFLSIVVTDPMKTMDDDAFPKRMAELVIELLSSPEQISVHALPGLWNALQYCMMHSPPVARHAFEQGLTSCLVGGLQQCGQPADWVVRQFHSDPM